VKPKLHCTICGLVRNAAVHGGAGYTHDFEAPAKQTKRARLNSRSEKTSEWYADVRIPEVKAAIGDGKQPCQIASPVCTRFVEGLHEPLTRARAGSAQRAHDAGTVPCCHACNSWISQSVDGQRWASERGLLLKAGVNQ